MSTTIDDDIKKHSRKWLIDLVGLFSFENLLAMRDILDAIADVIEDQLDRMWKAKQKRLIERPPDEAVNGFETLLQNYVKSDIKPEERWSEIKLWWGEILLPDLKQTIDEMVTGREQQGPSGDVYTITKEKIEKSLRIFLRGSPGRNSDIEKNERYAQASRIREELKWSFKKLAQELFPEEYAKNPKNAASMVCQGIKRYRKITNPNEVRPTRPGSNHRPVVH